MNLIWRGFIVVFGLLFIWQIIVSVFGLPSYILPSPFAVLHVLLNQAPLLFSEAIPTIIETMIGFILGVAIGCGAALCIAFFRPLAFWLLPILIISQAIPTFAIAPLLVIWFGFGLASKIATTVLMLFFPVTSAFYDGLKRTDQNWLDLAKTMNAKKSLIFWHIRIPAALPHLASGIRLAAVIAPIGAIIGEWVGASQGLGFLMLNANARMQIDVMFAALIIIIILSLLLYTSIDKILTKLITW